MNKKEAAKALTLLIFVVSIFAFVPAVACADTNEFKCPKKIFTGSSNSSRSAVGTADGSFFLLDGDKTSKNAVLADVTQYVSDGYLSAAITADGKLYWWGDVIDAASGTGVYVKSRRGISQELSDLRFKEISVGSYHLTALCTNGDLYSWGYNISGQVGNGKSGYGQSVVSPVKILSNVKKISSGGIVALRDNGDLYSWGPANNSNAPSKIGPPHVVDFGQNGWAITNDHSLYRWGTNTEGQIGDGTTSGVSSSDPKKVLEDVRWTDGTCAIKYDNSLYCWGSNACGQVGNGSTVNCLLPVKILENVKEVTSFSHVGATSRYALTWNNELYTWGYNAYGQIGNGTKENCLEPVKVLENVSSFSVSDNGAAYALTLNNDLYYWGNYGPSLATTYNRTVPTKILKNIDSVTLGTSWAFALSNTGELYSWGKNDNGQLGRTCSKSSHSDWCPDPTIIASHNPIALAAVSSQCTTEGKTEGKSCSDCDTVFVPQESVPAKGHSVVKDAGKAASCTASGLTEGSHCSTCNTTITSRKTVPALGHKAGAWKVVRAATETTEGLKTLSCVRCNTLMSTAMMGKLPSSEPAGARQNLAASSVDLIGASEGLTTACVTTAKGDDDFKGSTFGVLQAKAKAASKTAINVSWKKIAGAKKYIVYGAKCGGKYQVLTAVTGTTWTQKVLKKSTYYKHLVVAIGADGRAMAVSKITHTATKGGKVTNAKKIKLAKSKSSVKRGKSLKLKLAKVVPTWKGSMKTHRKITWEVSDPSVASVSSKGVIKGLKAGSCTVYAYAQDGVFVKKKIKVK